LQFADDVAKVFLRCLTVPYKGAGAYNIRGTVIDLAGFHRVLQEVDPEAAARIAHGDRQLPIAYDLDDSRLRSDIGPMRVTSLRDGVFQTLEHFKKLQREGRLTTEDLPAAE